MLKLNLGCGKKKMHGFVNIDIRKEVHPDVVDDVFLLKTVEPESVDLIYACHVLEHADRKAVDGILYNWHHALKPNGVLRVCVPDLRAACQYYLATSDLEAIHGLLYGGQRNDWDFHRVGFDEAALTEALMNAGFLKASRYDWRTTEHAFVDDYSQSYLPAMKYHTRNPIGTIEGNHVSLNMEAVK
jgi:predicted SAM-dependent methyltransferase